MKYVIQITPDGNVNMKKYTSIDTIEGIVGGYFEIAGQFNVLGKICEAFSNKYPDDCIFNPLASTLCSRPISGNIAIMIDGYDDNGIWEALPIDYQTAKVICRNIKDMETTLSPLLIDLAVRYYPTPEILALSRDEIIRIIERMRKAYESV